jgi:hypothetical protein
MVLRRSKWWGQMIMVFLAGIYQTTRATKVTTKTYGDETGFYFRRDERGMTRKRAEERDVRIHAYNLILL